MMSFSDAVSDVEVKHNIYGFAFICLAGLYVLFHFLLLVGGMCVQIFTFLRLRYIRR